MKRTVLFLIFSILAVFSLSAQSVAQGISYQAVAKDASGNPIVNSKVSLRISLVSEVNGKKAYFSELHQVTTDDQGQFNLVIGEGKKELGTIKNVPWSKEQIWLDVEMAKNGSQAFELVNHAKLLSVPYAKYAASTSRISEKELPGEEKNQSIYWLTGGNSLTAPPTHFLGTRDGKDLVFKTNNTTRVVVTASGQMKVYSGVDGNDDELSAYPVTIMGSTQGINIKVNGSRSGDNNFVTFADDAGVWGRIEGQTLDELYDSWPYQLQRDVFILQGVSLGLRIAAWTVKAIGEGASIFAGAAAVGSAANIVNFVIQAAAILAESITWGVNIVEEIGVTYESGAGDYAEWLERKPGERDLQYGEIVGVKGGQVSLNTDEADDFLVVSMRPIVAGNAPQPGQQANYEQIAFMGQVPVKVAGPVAVGDYILPSGNNDGFGVAIHPKEMKSGDYDRIVGVAWEASKGEAPFSMVKAAIGINSEDLAGKVDALNQKVEQILAYLEGKAPLEGGDFTSAAPVVKPHSEFKKIYSDEEFNKALDRYEPFFKGVYAQLAKEMEKQGYDLAANPKIAEFLKDPVPLIKEIRKDPNYLTQWAFIDQNIKSGK